MENAQGNKTAPRNQAIPHEIIQKIRSRLNAKPQFLRIYRGNNPMCFIIPADVPYDPSKPDLRKLARYQVSEPKFLLKRQRERILKAQREPKKTN